MWQGERAPCVRTYVRTWPSDDRRVHAMQRRQGQRLSVHCRGHPHRRHTGEGGPRVQELAKPWQSCGVRVRAWAHASVALATTIVWLAWAHVSRFDRSPLPPAPFHTTSCLKIAGYLGSCALYCTTGVPLH